MSTSIDLSNLNEKELTFYNYVTKPRALKTMDTSKFDEEDWDAYNYAKYMYYDFNTGIPFEVYFQKIADYLKVVSNLRKNRYIPNPEQRLTLVLNVMRLRTSAGAGGGKTTTAEFELLMKQAIYRIDAQYILACTFSDAGAKNMKERYIKIRTEMDSQYSVDFSTIHSFCSKLVIHLTKCQVIAENKPAIIHVWNEDEHVYINEEIPLSSIIMPCINTYAPDSYLSPKRVLAAISYVLETGIETDEEFKENEKFQDFPVTLGTLEKINEAYVAKKAENEFIDFTDMLTIALEFLQSLPKLDKSVDGVDDFVFNILRKRMILIDEYQDTTPLQNQIVNEILRLNPDCVLNCMGDDDQGIFAFTGCDIKAIVEFAKDRLYEGVACSYITENRRSAAPIVDLASKFVAQNTYRIEKDMKAMRVDLPCLIKPIIPPDGCDKNLIFKSTAMAIVNKARAEGIKLNSIALMYREHRQAIPYMLEMIRNRIPVNCLQDEKNGGIIYPCYLNQVKDIINIITWLYNPKSDWHISKYLPFIVPGLKPHIAKEIADTVRSDRNAKVLSILNKNPTFRDTVKEIVAIFNDMKAGIDCDVILPQILSLYYKASIEPKLKSNRKKEEAKKSLKFNFDFTTQYFQLFNNVTLSQMIEEHKRICQWVKDFCNVHSGVVFRTYFAGKGDEFNTVILLPLSDEISPKPSMIASYSEAAKLRTIEVERRQLYVAMTRAICNLYLFMGDEKSQFVQEIMKFLPSEGINTYDKEV